MDAASSATTVGAVRAPTISSRRLRTIAIAVLIVLGMALLILGSVVLLDTSAPGKSTVEKHSFTKVSVPPAAQPGNTVTHASSNETTIPGKAGVRSESVAAALFGLGAILFLVGIFFGRIQEVTLPGGAGFKLSPDEQKALKEKVAKKVKQDPNLTTNPETTIALYEATLSQLRSRSEGKARRLGYAVPVTGARSDPPPDEDTLDQVIDRAADSLH